MSEYVPFYKLEIWQIGLKVINDIYQLCKKFPGDEKYGLVTQMKRSAVSICANIAEGRGRYHYLDKTKFYINARGSLFELESHLIIAKELDFINQNDFKQLSTKIKSLSIKLNNFITHERKQGGNNDN